MEIDDRDGEGIIRKSREVDTLHNLFYRRFSAANFLFVFFFMQGYLDIERSKPLGKYYLQST